MQNKISTWEDMVNAEYPISDIKKDSPEFEIMKNAAKNGDPSAQHSMGIWYGEVAKDLEKAKNWYRRAAGEGREGAQESYTDLLYSENNEV